MALLRRQVMAGLLAYGSGLQSALSAQGQWHVGRRSPFTVAGAATVSAPDG